MRDIQPNEPLGANDDSPQCKKCARFLPGATPSKTARANDLFRVFVAPKGATGLDQSRRVQDAFCGVSVSPAITQTKEPQEASGLQSVMEMPQATRLT